MSNSTRIFMSNSARINAAYKRLSQIDNVSDFKKCVALIRKSVDKEAGPGDETITRPLKVIREIVAGKDKPAPLLLDLFSTPLSRYQGRAFALNFWKFIPKDLQKEMREIATIAYSEAHQ